MESGFGEEFEKRQLESELVDITMQEIVEVLGDLLGSYTLQVEAGYQPANASIAVASRLFEVLLSKFGPDVWPPEFLQACAEIQQLARKNGESGQ